MGKRGSQWQTNSQSPAEERAAAAQGHNSQPSHAPSRCHGKASSDGQGTQQPALTRARAAATMMTRKRGLHPQPASPASKNAFRPTGEHAGHGATKLFYALFQKSSAARSTASAKKLADVNHASSGAAFRTTAASSLARELSLSAPGAGRPARRESHRRQEPRT